MARGRRAARSASPKALRSSRGLAGTGGERHVGGHGEVREQRVILKQEAGAALLRRQTDAARGVEPRLAAEERWRRHRAAPARRAAAAASSCPAPEGPNSTVTGAGPSGMRRSASSSKPEARRCAAARRSAHRPYRPDPPLQRIGERQHGEGDAQQEERGLRGGGVIRAPAPGRRWRSRRCA